MTVWSSWHGSLEKLAYNIGLLPKQIVGRKGSRGTFIEPAAWSVPGTFNTKHFLKAIRLSYIMLGCKHLKNSNIAVYKLF